MSARRIAPWTIGEPLLVGDLTHYREFEELLPSYIDTDISLDSWKARPDIGTQLRQVDAAHSFNGRLTIEIVPLPIDVNPRDILLKSKRPVLNIWGNVSKGNQFLTDINGSTRDALCFDLFAAATSSGRREPTGYIDTTVVYALGMGSEFGLRRYLTQPRIKGKNAFTKLRQKSIANAIKNNRTALEYPLPGSITQ